MKLAIRIIAICFSLAYVQGLEAQEVTRITDSTKIYNLNDITVTATKTNSRIMDVPVRVNSVTEAAIKSKSVISAEDVLKNISGVFVTRNFGIYDKNATVIVRGVGKEQARTLIMLDGVPLNKLSTGSANMSIINFLNIEKVEVVKGPNSNIYGGNSMGGTVNFISKRINEGVKVNIEADYASYNTVGTKANVVTKKGKLFLGINGFARKSDGYNPYKNQDSTTIKMKLDEKIFGGSIGYNFTNKDKLEFNFSQAQATRGKGDRIYTKPFVIDGSNEYKNQSYRLSFNSKRDKYSIGLTAFLGIEDFTEIKWKGSDIFDVDVKRKDYGVWLSYNYWGFKNNNISAGVEYRGGSVLGKDIYRTTTDIVVNKGEANSVSLYLQDEIQLLNKKMAVIPSLRVDYALVGNGGFFIENGTKITQYLNPYTGSLGTSNHSSFSPKLAIQYKFNENQRIYASISNGFRHGSLEDMCRTGAISGGVILANISLKPEYINTSEIGSDIKLFGKVRISPSVNYSIGTDFIYAVNTGQKINVNGKQRPLLSLQNIGRVEIYGGEVDINYSPFNGVDLFTNYSFTNSTIKKYNSNPLFGDINLEGKHLTYTPKHMFNIGGVYRNYILSMSASYRFTSMQYMDSGNSPDTDKYINNIPSRGYFDFKVWKNITRGATLSFGVNNLFDQKYLDTSSLYSMGRYIYTQINISLTSE